MCVYVTGVATEKAISSFYYYSIFTIESPELLKATLKAFHWTQKALDRALGYFPTNKLHLTRLATALQVFETPVASAVEPWTEKTPKKVRAGRSWESPALCSLPPAGSSCPVLLLSPNPSEPIFSFLGSPAGADGLHGSVFQSIGLPLGWPKANCLLY